MWYMQARAQLEQNMIDHPIKMPAIDDLNNKEESGESHKSFCAV